MSRTRVAVVGGSIAGLALAGLLDPERFAVTIHEERPERAEAGSSLALWPDARRVLDDLGVGDRAGRLVHEVGTGSLRDATGRPLVSPPTGASMQMILRPALIELVEQAVPDTVRRVHERVVRPEGLPADLVVGADGVRSVVRRSAFGEHTVPRLTPWLALRGLLPGTPPENGEYWGRGDLAGVVEAPGGTYWFTTHVSSLGTLPAEAGGDPWRRSLVVDVDEALTEARRVFGGTADRAPAVLDVLNQADAETTLAQRIYEAPPMRRLVHGRAVLVGDAAHAMTPNLGRGACEALVGARILASELNTRDLGSALTRYEARRLLPGAVLRRTSHALMQVALATRLQPARDRALRGVGTALARAPRLT